MGIVRRTRVHSQEQLRGLLHDEGIDVTQATLSRDIRELRLAKVAHPAGGSYYAPSSNDTMLIITRSERARRALAAKLRELGGSA